MNNNWLLHYLIIAQEKRGRASRPNKFTITKDSKVFLKENVTEFFQVFRRK